MQMISSVRYQVEVEAVLREALLVLRDEVDASLRPWRLRKGSAARCGGCAPAAPVRELRATLGGAQGAFTPRTRWEQKNGRAISTDELAPAISRARQLGSRPMAIAAISRPPTRPRRPPSPRGPPPTSVPPPTASRWTSSATSRTRARVQAFQLQVVAADRVGRVWVEVAAARAHVGRRRRQRQLLALARPSVLEWPPQLWRASARTSAVERNALREQRHGANRGGPGSARWGWSSGAACDAVGARRLRRPFRPPRGRGCVASYRRARRRASWRPTTGCTRGGGDRGRRAVFVGPNVQGQAHHADPHRWRGRRACGVGNAVCEVSDAAPGGEVGGATVARRRWRVAVRGGSRIEEVYNEQVMGEGVDRGRIVQGRRQRAPSDGGDAEEVEVEEAEAAARRGMEGGGGDGRGQSQCR